MRDLCKMLFISIMSTACQKPDDFLQSVFLTTIEDGQIAEAVRQPIRITAATITQRQETPNSVQALDVSRSHTFRIRILQNLPMARVHCVASYPQNLKINSDRALRNSCNIKML